MTKGIKKYLPNPEESLACAALIAACVHPVVGAVAESVTGAASYVIRRQTEKQDRARKDAERQLKLAFQAYSESGRHQLDDDEVDLLMEMIENALREDEEIKRELYYDPLIGWMVKEPRPKEKVRAISNAISQLSASELYAFLVLHMSDKNTITDLLAHIHGREYAQEYVTSRFRYLGLQRDDGKVKDQRIATQHLGRNASISQTTQLGIKVTPIGHDFIDAIRDAGIDLQDYKIRIFGAVHK